MEQQEELKAHLMATNEQFRTLAAQHAELKHQLQEIESRGLLTLEDEDQEHQIKKQKLHLKDQMNEMLARYKAEQVA